MRLRLGDDNATISELIANYKQRAAQRPDTIRINVRSLRMVIKTVHIGDPDSKSNAVLTANLIVLRPIFEKHEGMRVVICPPKVARLSDSPR